MSVSVSRLVGRACLWLALHTGSQVTGTSLGLSSPGPCWSSGMHCIWRMLESAALPTNLSETGRGGETNAVLAVLICLLLLLLQLKLT